MPRKTSIPRVAVPAALLLLAGVAGAFWWGPGEPEAPPATQRTERLEIVTKSGAVRVFAVEVARTPEEQATGLMYRTQLADDAGMLFVHEVPREATMWMRNTYIPLDMVFIRADGTVHSIEARTEPLSEEIISSGGEVSAVLELAGGAAARLGIMPGDHVRHPFFGHSG